MNFYSLWFPSRGLTCRQGGERAHGPGSIWRRPSRHRSPPGTPSASAPPAPETRTRGIQSESYLISTVYSHLQFDSLLHPFPLVWPLFYLSPVFFPDTGSEFFIYRIKEFKFFNPKNCVQALGTMIRDVHPGSGSWFFIHPGTLIQIHNIVSHQGKTLDQPQTVTQSADYSSRKR